MKPTKRQLKNCSERLHVSNKSSKFSPIGINLKRKYEMNDLTGEDAFDRTLEAAMESRASANNELDRRHDAESRLRAVQTELHQALSKVEALAGQQARALPKLAELWQAARAVTNSNAPEGLERLRAALAAAADHCDEIPF
jgi:hypothetical protein